RGGLPGVRSTAAVEDGDRQRHVSAARGETDGRRGGAPRGFALHRDGGARTIRGRISAPAVGRYETARSHRAVAGDRSGDAADGRAVREPGRIDPPQDAGRSPRDLADDAQDHPLRHAFDTRGRPARRSYSRAVQGTWPGAPRDRQPRRRAARHGRGADGPAADPGAARGMRPPWRHGAHKVAIVVALVVVWELLTRWARSPLLFPT